MKVCFTKVCSMNVGVLKFVYEDLLLKRFVV